MSQLKLYTNPESRAVVVELLLAELGVDYERIVLEFGSSMKSAEYLKINPFGKVPTLVDGDVVIYELAAICTYLADKYADRGFAPQLNDPTRGLYYRWMFFAAGPWEAADVNQMLGVTVGKEQEMFVGYGNYDTMYQALILGLEEANPYLCGAQLTAADIMIGAYLNFLLKIGKIPSDPTIQHYLDTLKQRPSLNAAFTG